MKHRPAVSGRLPHSVLSTIRYFRDEYNEHIRDKTCRAGVCTELMKTPRRKEWRDKVQSLTINKKKVTAHEGMTI